MNHAAIRFCVSVLAVVYVWLATPVLAKPAHKPSHASTQSTQVANPSAAQNSTDPSDNDGSNSASKNPDQPVVVAGVNKEGVVKVNNLANLEALLNIIANGAEILGIAIGGPLAVFGIPAGIVMLFFKGKRWLAIPFILTGPLILLTGLAMPGFINWLVASARDAHLFD